MKTALLLGLFTARGRALPIAAAAGLFTAGLPAACSGGDTAPYPNNDRDSGAPSGNGSGGNSSVTGDSSADPSAGPHAGGDDNTVAEGPGEDDAAPGSEVTDPDASWLTGPIRPTRYRIPDPAFAEPPCDNAGSGTITASEVLIGQTHLTPRGWPFQTVVAARPLTVGVTATGSGSSPPFTATAVLGDQSLTVCLRGPAHLPTATDGTETAAFRGTFPAAWVQPGLEITVDYGDQTHALSPTVVAETGLTLYVVDAELFGEEGSAPSSDAVWRQLLARLPHSWLDVGRNPFGVWRPTRLLVGSRSDGREPDGTAGVSHGPMVIRENPHCNSADKAAGTCTLHSGFGTMSAVLRALRTFRVANGVASASTWYADVAVRLGGGLGGGQVGVGDSTGLVMNHELGHAWGFPHWDASHTEYPYEGVLKERGGFGDRYGIDQVSGDLVDVLCKGTERQSPMQRKGTCVPEGSSHDPFSDYESARLLRMTTGAAENIDGEVPYHGGTLPGTTRPFRLKAQKGRQALMWNENAAGFHFQRYDESTLSWQPEVLESWNRIAQSEAPVVMFHGAAIFGGEAYVEEPISYVGNLLRTLDPTTPEGWAELYAGRQSEFRRAMDITYRLTLEDGSVRAQLGEPNNGSFRSPGDTVRFAVNLPKDLAAEVVKFEVLSRPLGQFNQSSRIEEDFDPAAYFDTAEVVATWNR